MGNGLGFLLELGDTIFMKFVGGFWVFRVGML